mmetsp:Transcript_77042/g.249594  ORF Transcript_77042/g.249594 Transcript_77042/m.249594 type:complete len:167 (+) Transcript_77042:2160-2660(+)
MCVGACRSEQKCTAFFSINANRQCAGTVHACTDCSAQPQCFCCCCTGMSASAGCSAALRIPFWADVSKYCADAGAGQDCPSTDGGCCTYARSTPARDARWFPDLQRRSAGTWPLVIAGRNCRRRFCAAAFSQAECRRATPNDEASGFQIWLNRGWQALGLDLGVRC